MLRENSALAVMEPELIPQQLPIKYPPLRRVELKEVIKPKQEIIRPHWWNEELGGGYHDRCRAIVRDFVNGKLVKRAHGYGSGHKGTHIYSTRNNGTELWMYKNNPSIKVSICVARKLNDNFFVGNASALMAMRQPLSKKQKALGRKVGRLTWAGGAQVIQDVLSEVMPMVPFRMFKEAQLDITQMSIIEKAKDEMIDVGRKEKGKHVLTHYTGAMVFKIGVNKRSRGVQGKSEEYFLFDIDRNDLALKNFNAFLSKLSRPVVSIKDAYDSLKPLEVWTYENEKGVTCPRQGEWFFIPVEGRYRRSVEPTPSWRGERRGRKPFQRAILQSKGNRAHYVKFMCEEGFVTGDVTHGGHEHKPIALTGWHKPVPNTAIGSFKISGSVD